MVIAGNAVAGNAPRRVNSCCLPPFPREPAMNPALSRRQLLRAGAVAPLRLALPEFLHAAEPGRREKHCVFVFQYGGLSQLDSWDPKPDAPAEIRGPYRPIPTAVPG